MPCRTLPAILTVAATLVAGTALADDVSGTVTEIDKGRGTLTINGQELYTISIPMANRREANRPRAERSGRRMLTRGAARAPRCLYRKPMLVASAQASASRMPRNAVIKGNLERKLGA